MRFAHCVVFPECEMLPTQWSGGKFLQRPADRIDKLEELEEGVSAKGILVCPFVGRRVPSCINLYLLGREQGGRKYLT